MLTAVTISRLEEAATDNGFDLNLERTADWLSFDNTQTPMPIWLGAMDECQFVAAPIAGRRPGRVGGRWCGVHQPNPAWSCRRTERQRRRHTASHVETGVPALATPPNALLRVFHDVTAKQPHTTEAERLVVQRVGQDIFRRGLLEY